ncbi:MAG: hypothetical protein HZB68_03300 [Candidatus Aenigmarchaeota archaeon]|nr:hypothetical protein [Candidatus Aenigmarchaeota archaeon]
MRDKKLFHKILRTLESRDIEWDYRSGKRSSCMDSDSYSCIFPYGNNAYKASLKRETYFIDEKDDEVYTLSVISGKDEIASWYGQWPRALYRLISKRPATGKPSKAAKARKLRGL